MRTYSEEQYAMMSIEANKKGMNLYILRKPYLDSWCDSLEIAPYNYYLCSQRNITDGTINPNFKQEQEATRQLRLDNKSLAPFDFLKKIKELGATDIEIEDYLNGNLLFKHTFLFRPLITCKEVKSFCPLDIGNLHLTIGKIEKLFE